MKKIILTLAFGLWTLDSGLATPVLFITQNLTGTVNNRQILVTPDVLQNPLWHGTNLVSLQPFTLQPVNGQVITNLTPWGYTIKVDGWPRSIHVVVPDDTNTWNVVRLINTNQFAPLNIYDYTVGTNTVNLTNFIIIRVTNYISDTTIFNTAAYILGTNFGPGGLLFHDLAGGGNVVLATIGGGLTIFNPDSGLYVAQFRGSGPLAGKMYTPATGIMFNSPDGVSGQPSTSIVFTNPDAFLLSGPGGNTDGSGLAISNAAGAIFTLMVNSTTNGLTFTPR